MENEKKTRKARTPKKTLIQFIKSNSDATGTWFDEDATPEDTESAIKWVKENGVNDYTYRIITVQYQGKFTRTPVTTEKVSFA